MNPPIVRLYAFFALLFGVLVFATSWWSVFGAEDLRENTANRRPLLAEERIKRGTIRAADGKVLARSSVKFDKERYRAQLSDRRACSPTRSATRSPSSAARGSSSSATTR